MNRDLLENEYNTEKVKRIQPNVRFKKKRSIPPGRLATLLSKKHAAHESSEKESRKANCKTETGRKQIQKAIGSITNEYLRFL